MPALNQTASYLTSKDGEAFLSRLYGGNPVALKGQKERYLDLLDSFSAGFPGRSHVAVFSSPGRSEVGGNHTDHNAGRILAAAVDLDIIAAAAVNDDGLVRVYSEGYPSSIVSLNELELVEAEKNSAISLIRGVCARFQQLGLALGGFDVVATSRVPKGSGLSSSAAFEVLMATILNHLYNGGQVDKITIAQIGQYAEKEYFGKPCGLMDQMTCAVGGFVTIDFKDSDHPVVKKLEFDFAASGYSMVIVDTAGDHANLTDEYESAEREMRSVARALGGKVLREFSEQQMLDQVASLREKVSDRAILRAFHFFRDDQRVVEQVAALEANDFQRFLQLIGESGESSWMYLQNSYSPKYTSQQGIPIALMLSKAILESKGAWRVHGGGFAGTIQAFVPNEDLSEYVTQVERVFGTGSCHVVRVRPEGAVKLGLFV
jgi:galactokinase